MGEAIENKKQGIKGRISHYSAQTSPTSRKILKVMSIFTGVEFLGILCSMIKMKFVALWLDALGVGIFNIFNTTIETTTYLTGLGIRQSSVRELASAKSRGEGYLRKMIGVVRSWSVVAALLGGMGLTALSWPLAEIFFDDGSMWWNFAILGGAMILNSLYAGESAVFQATESFMRLARAGIIGAIGGLIVSLPLFYLLGNKSISLSIIVYSLITMIAGYMLRDKKWDTSDVSISSLRPGVKMVKLGAWISITGFFSSLCQLVFISWLNRTASTAEVGLYGAGMTLVIRYTGLVFNSVILEFYPRISANLSHPRRMNLFINHEVTLLLLLFTPLLLLFLIFREWIVYLLYSSEFLPILPFITWGIILIIFRVVSNTLGMCILAKGEGKIYMLSESADALLGLALSIWLYNDMGLEGLGIALVIWHFCYLVLVSLISRYRYHLNLCRNSVILTVVSAVTAFGSVALIYTVPQVWSVTVMSVVAMVYIYCFLRFLFSRRKSRTPLSQSAQ